ncbi:MAG TPA: hypothetical protein VKA40_04360, partial [Nitrososphaera sp.]|nr:hypothetical protein [Nitrososphaera sp.]
KNVQKMDPRLIGQRVLYELSKHACRKPSIALYFRKNASRFLDLQSEASILLILMSDDSLLSLHRTAQVSSSALL